jgi:hypothetical protein
LVVLLAACDSLGTQRSKQIELAGEWDWMDGFTQFPIACGSDVTIQYQPNGQYSLFGEGGTWDLNGSTLTEAMTALDPIHSDATPADIGKKYVSTLRWVDENTFAKQYSDGDVMAFLRCPTPN